MLRRCGILFLCIVCLICSSCGGQRRSEELLSSLLEVSGELPEGEIYRSEAEVGGEGYLPPTVREVLYGAEAEELFSLLENYAIYVSSFASPCEIGVFVARSASDAPRIAAMCLERRDTVSVLLRQMGMGDRMEAIRIVHKGKTVIMGLTDKPDAFERAALRLAR